MKAAAIKLCPVPEAGQFSSEYRTLVHWRGIAALSVVVFHGFGAISIADLTVHPSVAWLKWVSDFGGFGMHLFFVISGYCIAANIYRLSFQPVNAWEFLRDRLLRIYPVYWAACLAAILLNALSAPFNRVRLYKHL